MVKEKLKVINLFGGPGTGKSITRAELFARMKRKSYIVEEVTEYAKDVTWEKNFSQFEDQLFMLAQQNRRLSRLQGQVDWAISDSPILLGIHYMTPNYLPNNFVNLMFEVWDTYDNYNFFLRRTKPYEKVGRTQTEEQARKIDEEILHTLKENNIPTGQPPAPVL